MKKRRPRLRVGDTVEVVGFPKRSSMIDRYRACLGKEGTVCGKGYFTHFWPVRFSRRRIALSFYRHELKLVKRGKK